MQVAPLVPVLHFESCYTEDAVKSRWIWTAHKCLTACKGQPTPRPALWPLEVWNPSHGLLLWSHWQLFIVSVGDIKRLKLSRNPSLPGFIQHYLKVVAWFVPPVCICTERFIPLVVIRSCWLCQEYESWKSAFLASRCLLVLSQLCQGRGVKSGKNVNTGEKVVCGSLEENPPSSPPWQTRRFASVTPAVVKWLEWKLMGKGMVLLL